MTNNIHPDRFLKEIDTYWEAIKNYDIDNFICIDEIIDPNTDKSKINAILDGLNRFIYSSDEKILSARIITVFWQKVFEKQFELSENKNYSSFIQEENTQRLLWMEVSFWKDIIGEIFDFGNYMAEVIVRHSVSSWINCGRKVYEVSPGLRWRLENTKLKGYPSSDLKLPYNSLYVKLPPTYGVYNLQTGMHDSEGCYIIEDRINEKERKWRIVLIGQINENSRYENDDALYHWTIHFDDNKTLDECVEYSRIQAMNTPVGKEKEVYEKLEPILLKLFDYLINMVLYATMSEADSMIIQSDSEYQRLFDRAMKLDKKSKKRRNLLNRAKNIQSHPIILLGGKLYVDRSKDLSGNKEGISGRSLKVRTLVSGHWRNQAKGKGRQERERIWIEPFWRGPEFAPITNKTHVMR